MTNPETCYHNVVQPAADSTGWVGILCVSCDATLSPEFVREYFKNYHYDIDYNVWVHTNPFKSESDCSLCPPQKGCNSPSPSHRMHAMGEHTIERMQEEFAKLHTCHTDIPSSNQHALACPTGEHLGGWQHMQSEHFTCKECGPWIAKLGPESKSSQTTQSPTTEG